MTPKTITRTTLIRLTHLLLLPFGASQAALSAADGEALASVQAQQTVPVGGSNVSVMVDLGQSIHTMRGGIGASWHAIGPTVFHYPKEASPLTPLFNSPTTPMESLRSRINSIQPRRHANSREWGNRPKGAWSSFTER